MKMFLPRLAKPVAQLAAQLYELGVRSRLQLYERGWLPTYKLPAPVISVGNLTTGGTGKTPCTAYLAQMLRAANLRVAILSRGYKRQSKGLIEVSDGTRVLCEAATAGDEPYLLATQCPGVRVVVNADRYAAGWWLAQRAEVDMFLLDDGYQHIRLHRDVNLALVDAGEDLLQARLLPAGHWREPVEQLRRADAVIITRAESGKPHKPLATQLRQHTSAPIFYAAHELATARRLRTTETQPLTAFQPQPVGVFTGIARPEKFIADLQRAGLRIVWQRTFADHHRYNLSEARALLTDAEQSGAAVVLTTEKDAANLPVEFADEGQLWVTPLRFRCFDEEALRTMLLRALAGR